MPLVEIYFLFKCTLKNFFTQRIKCGIEISAGQDYLQFIKQILKRDYFLDIYIHSSCNFLTPETYSTSPAVVLVLYLLVLLVQLGCTSTHVW